MNFSPDIPKSTTILKSGKAKLKKFCFVDVSFSFCEITGYTVDELLNVNIEKLYNSETEYDEFIDMFASELTYNDFGSISTFWKTKSGEIIKVAVMMCKADEGFIDIVASELSNTKKVVNDKNSILQSITDDKNFIQNQQKIETSFQQNHQLLSDSFKIAKIGCWEMNLNSMKLFWNREAYKIYGFNYLSVEPSFEVFLKIVHPDDVAYIKNHLENVLNTNIFPEFECRIVTPNGLTKYILVAGEVVCDANKKPYRVYGIVQDITNQKQFEEQLFLSKKWAEESEYFLREAQRIGNIGSFKFNFQTGYAVTTETLNEMLGLYDIYDRKTTKWMDTIFPDDKENVLFYLQHEVIEQKKDFNLEYRIINIHTKEPRWVHCVGNVHYDEDSKPLSMLGTIQDITIRKNYDCQLYETMVKTEENERARYAKELHDGLGPILSTCLIYLNAIKKKDDKVVIDELSQQTIGFIEDGLKSIKEISNNLSPAILKKFGLTDAVRSFIEKLNIVTNLKFRIESSYSVRKSELVEITLYRVLIELINNSLKYSNAGEIQISFVQSNEESLEIIYKDNGCGFDYENVKKLTTGFGLSNLENRIDKIGGEYNYWSKPGSGVKVKIFIN